MAEEFPGLDVEPVVGDFERHLGELPRHPRRLLAFLGSTIGNLEPGRRARPSSPRSARRWGRGTPSCSAPTWSRTRRAWSRRTTTPQGVTAAFNKNVLAVLDRELGADFKAEAFEHRAVWDAEHEWIEMRLESIEAQRVHVAALDLDVSFEAGEQMRTEISAKFRRDGIERELAAAGLRLVHWWTDPDGRLRVVAVGARLRRAQPVDSAHGRVDGAGQRGAVEVLHRRGRRDRDDAADPAAARERLGGREGRASTRRPSSATTATRSSRSCSAS